MRPGTGRSRRRHRSGERRCRVSTETLNTALQDLRCRAHRGRRCGRTGGAAVAGGDPGSSPSRLTPHGSERDEAKAALDQDRKSYDAFAARLTEANQILQAQVARLMKAPAARRVMIDLETFGTRPGGAHRLARRRAFRRGKDPRPLLCAHRPAGCAQARGLVIDAATVVWWMQQSAESRIEIAGAVESRWRTCSARSPPGWARSRRRSGATAPASTMCSWMRPSARAA